MQDMVRAGAWKGLSELIKSSGGDPDAIFTAVGLPSDLSANPNAYFPVKSLIASLELAAETLDQPDFGLRSGVHASLALGTLTLAIFNAPTAREGIELAARYIHIHNRDMAIEILPHPGPQCELVCCRVRDPALIGSVQLSERIVGGVFYHLKAILGATFQPEAIRFTTPRLSDPSVYRSAFGIDPVFECETGGIVISSTMLDEPRSGRDENILEAAKAHLNTLDEGRLTRLTDKVDVLIRSFLVGSPCTIQQIASALGLHHRTLQRRLRDEGVCFEHLKDEAKRRRAEKLLARSDVTLTDVAFMLGYTESSTFSRKARDWFGVTPRIYRRRLKSEPASQTEKLQAGNIQT